MAINYVSLVGKSQKGEFWGSGNTAKFRSVRTLQVIGFGPPPSLSTDGQISTITINGINFGSGRVVAVRQDADGSFGGSGVGNNKFVATVEQYIDGEITHTNFQNNPISNLKYLESFSEDLSADLGENENFVYTHTIRIRYLKPDSSTNPINLAKTSAENIFNQTNYDTVFGGIAYSRAGRKYFSESYNSYTNECSFTRVYVLYPKNTSATYSAEIISTINFDPDGVLSVTEIGNLRGLNTYTNAKDGVDTEIGLSYTRCNQIFTEYLSVNGQSAEAESLLNKAVDLQRKYDQIAQTASYSITYSNTKNLDLTNLILFEEIVDTTLSSDVTTVCYKGSASAFSKRNSSFNGLSILTTKAPKALTGYNVTSRNFNYSNFGKRATYNVCFSNQTSLATGNALIRKKEFDVIDEPGILTHSFYVIPNQKVLVNEIGLTDLGTRKVTVKSLISRTAGNNFLTSPTNIKGEGGLLEVLSAEARNKCLEIYQTLSGQYIEDSSLRFIESHTYNIDSGRNLSVDINLKYVLKRNSYVNKII